MDRIEVPWIGYDVSDRHHLKKLQNKGYHVRLVGDASSGLVLLRTQAFPVVIVSDYVLKGEGLQVPEEVARMGAMGLTRYLLSEIRRLPGYEETPLVVPYLSGTSEDDLMLDSRIHPVRLSQEDFDLATAVERALLDTAKK